MKKMVLTLLAVTVALLAGGAWWLHRNLDGLLQSAIVTYGSAMTGSVVQVDAVQLQPGSGRGTLQGLRVGNPAGFQTPYALKASRIDLEIEPSSLGKAVVLVTKIDIVAPDVTYEKGNARTNFEAIQAHITRYLGPSTPHPETGKKLIVRDLLIRNAKAQASAPFMGGKTVTVALPDLHLRNVGLAEGGITPAELGREIANAMEKRLTAAVRFETLMDSVGGALHKAGQAVRGVFQ